MAYTKDEFLAALAATIAQYPAVAARYQVGDPTIIQAQGAMAQFAAMLSQQIDLASAEPFDKVRDSTVLADASLKGLTPMAKPARQKVSVTNNSHTPFTLVAGRSMLDSNGNVYRVDTPVTVADGQSGFVEVLQEVLTDIVHTVSGSKPFYEIQVPAPEDGTFISGIAVRDANGVQFTYRSEFNNVLNGEKIFHVEADEYRRLFVRFGIGGVVGYQPGNGEVFTLTVSYASGDIRPDFGSPFALEYIYTPQEGQIVCKMDSVLINGAEPTDIATLRELCKYPSIYDESAVFLGEFDLLVRKQMPDLKFLSIWNETIEEQVRGASLNNINVLFVSFVPPDGVPSSSIEPEITRIIAAADDSYEIVYINPTVLPIAIQVAASVGRIQDPEAVRQQIISVVLAEFGISAPAAQSGMLVPQNKRVSDLLRANVPALQDEGSDYSVSIPPLGTTLLPEQYRYVTLASLTVTVTLSNYNLGQWGR